MGVRIMKVPAFVPDTVTYYCNNCHDNCQVWLEEEIMHTEFWGTDLSTAKGTYKSMCCDDDVNEFATTTVFEDE
jgi:hypothetical protein